MTYEVLRRVSKKELISWLQKHVFLPNISDEDFLREVKLDTLFAKEQKLLLANKELNKQLEQAADNPIKFTELMIESQKLNEQINKVSESINDLLRKKEG